MDSEESGRSEDDPDATFGSKRTPHAFWREESARYGLCHEWLRFAVTQHVEIASHDSIMHLTTQEWYDFEDAARKCNLSAGGQSANSGVTLLYPDYSPTDC